MARQNRRNNSPLVNEEAATVYKHTAKRKNIPPAGLEPHGYLAEAQKIIYEYNPHLPPVLRISPEAAKTDALPELLQTALQRPLSLDEVKLIAEALRKHEPWLEWSGKREKPWFAVEPVPLHIHERVSTQAILRVLARQDVQRHLFADPQQEYTKAVQFYQHDVDWSNRMILGDSLEVMASLARRENLAGKVQMIYVDPPYGIKFSSNFQPKLGQREVKDRDQDLTREPEMIKAYRDTWTLGVHSYLSYLRDRIALARELLTDTGSVFVQISDENLHRIRSLMDEVFGISNFIGLITFTKKGSQTGEFVPPINEYIVWYAKHREGALQRFRQIYRERDDSEPEDFPYCQLDNGEIIGASELAKRETEGPVLSFSSNALFSQKPGPNEPVELRHQEFPSGGNSWKIATSRIPMLDKIERLLFSSNRVRFKRFSEDFPAVSLTNIWTDLAGASDKMYVVQTNAKVIERCMLMTTDPGDLVLDPTCGSGTTAYVAEQWGRRWITMDTSRVALAVARQRLMTARFPYYKLRSLHPEDLQRNPKGTWITNTSGKMDEKCTFQCKTVPHITLKSIARNASLDPIIAKHEPILTACLDDLNDALKETSPELRQILVSKLAIKQKKEGKKAITEADHRRWQLPKSEWKEWEVPFDTDPDWPEVLQDALIAYRQAWREKMDEVNECISNSAEMEELVDKPEVMNGIVRVSGPFSMEGVIAQEEGVNSPIGGGPQEDLETFGKSADVVAANAEAHAEKMLRLLRASGVDFPGNKNMKFARLEPLTDVTFLHAEGEWINGDRSERRVAVSIGPEIGNISMLQVEEALRVANRQSYDDLIFFGFGFEAEAQAAIQEFSHRNLKVHMALINPDVQMGDLLKTQPGSQIFTVFSAPRVKLQAENGQFIVEVEGMDVYDPVSNSLYPTSRERIAAWFLDSDYDERTFCICQAFFPDKSKWSKLAKALGRQGVINESAFEALSGFKSLPFPKGKYARAAVKMIDPRGNEGLCVVRLS
ncbi:MAG: site-specific DNA-methyltransferase [Syntrophobacteraceae bacterium]